MIEDGCMNWNERNKNVASLYSSGWWHHVAIHHHAFLGHIYTYYIYICVCVNVCVLHHDDVQDDVVSHAKLHSSYIKCENTQNLK